MESENAMKAARRTLTGLLVWAAAQAGTADVQTCGTVDAGGQRVTCADVTVDGSLGGIGGISSDAGTAQTAKHGYIGQLTEVTNLAVTASLSSVNEGGVCQLTGVARLDDASVLALAGSNIVWLAHAHPVAGIAAVGQATASLVWSNTTGIVTGVYLGVTGSGTFLVLDSHPDNWGSYAGDQIPDSWQIAYFGSANPAGQAGATNATGRDNLYTYVADLNPTNPASALEIVTVSTLISGRTVQFLPSSTGRVYRLLYATNLLAGGWTNLPDTVAVQGTGGPMSLTDTNSAVWRFYRIGVQMPP